ncbi:hypothetical protein GO495_11915 [Chitinophaga oryziterrae]|uniref:Uncharacterized protein n=1 Tax=Chitinophaga oryziterrae TaxID=1031224 RepID=A0A6N8JB04_9BACT|nr:hypothetical protein [Chitinophaga oryziterrae]MVT41292.1 hypothetical protein [Chitinophaga oryziterrae]
MQYNVQIIQLDVLEYKAYNPTTTKDDYSGKVNVRVKALIETDKKTISIIVNIDMLLNIAEDLRLSSVGTVNIVNTFLLADDDWTKYIIYEGDKPFIDKELDNFLVNISYHNSRGLLRERGKNDLFGKIILPLMVPQDIERTTT